MVKIKRVYDPVSPDDGKRILVDRLWPRGIKKEIAQVDEWIKDVAPSTELRKWFSHDRSKWQEFLRRYMLELGGKKDLIKRLRAEASKEPITLLFSAKDLDYNNAVVLKRVISKQ
ncbi:MAG: DUF488 domain-containing protein [Dissulfurispiraceae bacterium]